jgi:hypothetical protein
MPKAVCASGACVAAERVDRGVLVTSTIPENSNYILFTQDEWDQFLGDVKANRWDHTATKSLVNA